MLKQREQVWVEYASLTLRNLNAVQARIEKQERSVKQLEASESTRARCQERAQARNAEIAQERQELAELAQKQKDFAPAYRQAQQTVMAIEAARGGRVYEYNALQRELAEQRAIAQRAPVTLADAWARQPEAARALSEQKAAAQAFDRAHLLFRRLD